MSENPENRIESEEITEPIEPSADAAEKAAAGIPGETPVDLSAETPAETPAEDPADFVFPVEAALFALGKAVTVSELAKCAGCSGSTARKAARLLAKEYEKRGGGIVIREFDGVFQMCTAPKYYASLIKVVTQPKKPVLTDVVMETLAIIAYKAPTTKVEIEKVRGVNSDHAVNRLLEYGLVEECGRLDAPGRPLLFRPTEEFFRRFGVKNQKDLPGLSADAKAEIEAQAEKEAMEAIPVTT